MHTDNLTSEEIKEILVYSASHHAAWQIINNFKSMLWYKQSRPRDMTFYQPYSPIPQHPSLLDFKERAWQDHSWQRVVCDSVVSLPSAPANRNARQSHKNLLFPWSVNAAPTSSLQGDRDIQSVGRHFPACWPDLSETPDVEAIIYHSQQRGVLSKSNYYCW